MTIKAGHSSDQPLQSWYYFGFIVVDYQIDYKKKNILSVETRASLAKALILSVYLKVLDWWQNGKLWSDVAFCGVRSGPLMYAQAYLSQNLAYT